MKMVKTAPKFHEIAKRILEITESTTLVGHNIDFDYRMLRQSFKRLGYHFKINTLDTISLAKELIPEAESYSLGKLVKSLGIPLTDHHRAAGDARATLELFKLLISKDINNNIIQKRQEIIAAKTYLNKIKELTQDLPNERGIVYFQNGNGKIILSNFAENINKFSKRLFNSESNHWKNIQEECEQIHYELTGNEIIAKLMMKTKGILKPEKLPFGLYHKNGKYFVEKIALHKKENTLLKFKSFTQGLKALNYIKSKPELLDIENFTNLISLDNRDKLWLTSGRTLGEKAFLIFENGQISGFGFYDYFTQIQSKTKLNQLKIEVSFSEIDLENDLKLALLKEKFKITALPEK
jgi:DNA polymerase-3 subunit epsilon